MSPSATPEAATAPHGWHDGMHGVFIVITCRLPSSATEPPPTLGVLITGAAGIGKSELALQLVQRGHALVADDAPRFRMMADGRLHGACPPPFQGFLAVRGLGVLDLPRMYGPQALHAGHALDLIIHLTHEPVECAPEKALLEGEWQASAPQGLLIPALRLQARPGRPLDLLVEAATRQHLLRANGYHAADALGDRLARQFGKEST